MDPLYTFGPDFGVGIEKLPLWFLHQSTGSCSSCLAIRLVLFSRRWIFFVSPVTAAPELWRGWFKPGKASPCADPSDLPLTGFDCLSLLELASNSGTVASLWPSLSRGKALKGASPLNSGHRRPPPPPLHNAQGLVTDMNFDTKQFHQESSLWRYLMQTHQDWVHLGPQPSSHTGLAASMVV
jgi:hypothetical protein